MHVIINAALASQFAQGRVQHRYSHCLRYTDEGSGTALNADIIGPLSLTARQFKARADAGFSDRSGGAEHRNCILIYSSAQNKLTTSRTETYIQFSCISCLECIAVSQSDSNCLYVSQSNTANCHWLSVGLIQPTRTVIG